LLQQAQELTQKSKWAEGVPLWRQLADASPVNGNFWERLAWCLYQQKDYRQAIPAFARALELRAGGPANDAYNIACCHALLGEKEQALQWLEKALAIGFASLDHLRNDDDLKSLRSDSKYKELAGLPPRDKMSRVDGWRHDLKLLAREIKRVHFKPVPGDFP
jgi:tetratricopeptide (TPR) repeat protein